MSEEMNETTLYQRIGGELAINAAVDRFYACVLADPALNHFFTEAGISRLKAHQFAFLPQVLGGPKQYRGASMRDAHGKLAIEQCHFDSVAEHLVETLRELGVPENIIGEIATAVTPLSSEIVNTPTKAAIA